MTIKYLLDTNICIYIVKKTPVSVLHKLEKLKVGEVAMSIITYGELQYGAEKSQYFEKAKETLVDLATLIPPLPLTTDVGLYYGEIRAYLEKKGKLIGNNDLWISSHALALNTTLVTNNVKEFTRVPNLKVENWV